jgi:predicted ester cyclase
MMSSPQELKSVVRRFVTEPWSKGNLNVLDEVCAPNYRLGEKDTLDNLKEGIREYRRALPDLHGTVGEVIVDGDAVAYRWTMKGTHRGEYHGIAPTGKPVTLTGITILHFDHGKIVRDEFAASSPSLEEQVMGKQV